MARGLLEVLLSAAWTIAYRELAGLGRTGDLPQGIRSE